MTKHPIESWGGVEYENIHVRPSNFQIHTQYIWPSYFNYIKISILKLFKSRTFFVKEEEYYSPHIHMRPQVLHLCSQNRP